MKREVRQILALALLAVLGFTVAGCGSAKKRYSIGIAGSGGLSRAITVPMGHSTAFVKTGTLVRCKGGPGARVPRRGRRR